MSGTTVPIVLNASGAVPATPAALQQQLLAAVAATNPDYTANLPGTLIEDISSTDVGALVICDSALVDLINSISPYTTNEYLLTQLGNVYGVDLQAPTNTSVYVVFTGPPGYVIQIGFTVADGSHQYVVQDGGIIGTGGASQPIYCLATQTGTWAVPIGSVTQLSTSVPQGINLTVTNPQAGTPSTAQETYTQYRLRVLAAGLASAQGMPRFLKTLIGQVPGVQSRLIAVQQSSFGGWKIIVGGGDPYAVAYAIFQGLFDVSNLVGSTLAIGGVTNASPGVVTTLLNHGYTTGNPVTINGVVGMAALNGNTYTVTVITETTFSIGVDTTSYATYISGGVCTPNNRNIVVSINDYPDTYGIPIVLPPQQTVAITATWNTIASPGTYVSPTAVAQAANPVLVNYINNLPVGAPINELVMFTLFQNAVASSLNSNLLDRLVFAIYINGVLTAPNAGTYVVYGDPESYFETNASGTGITIVQG